MCNLFVPGLPYGKDVLCLFTFVDCLVIFVNAVALNMLMHGHQIERFDDGWRVTRQLLIAPGLEEEPA